MSDIRNYMFILWGERSPKRFHCKKSGHFTKPVQETYA